MDSQLCKIVDLMAKTRDERDGGSDCGFGSAEVKALSQCRRSRNGGRTAAT